MRLPGGIWEATLWGLELWFLILAGAAGTGVALGWKALAMYNELADAVNESSEAFDELNSKVAQFSQDVERDLRLLDDELRRSK